MAKIKIMTVLTQRQIDFLDKEAKRLGVSRNEVLRRLLDKVIDQSERKDKTNDRDLQDSQQE